MTTSTTPTQRIFWDIESYRNFFCTVFLFPDEHIEVHYLTLSDEDDQKVLQACIDSGRKYVAYDLKVDATVLKERLSKRIPSDGTSTLLSAFLGTKEEVVKPKEETYISYNGLSYDIQMMDNLTKSILAGKVQTTPESLRIYSDSLIDDTARRVSTRDYEMYAGQVDAAFLNEVMLDKGKITIGLKTLVGVKGGNIKESESNKSGFSKDIYDDVLYCINDCVELRDVVFPDKMEQVLNIREALLRTYPTLAENNVTPNSTSAKFVEFIVSPHQAIIDTPTVSFMYPAPHVAARKGVQQKDMLEYTREWYLKNVYQRILPNNPEAAKANLAKFMSIYDFYAAVRGKNWNDSAAHTMRFGIPAEPRTGRRALMGTYGTYLPLLDQYGNDSGTHVNFSLGGIHGAEVFVKQLEQDREKIRELRETYGKISLIPKGAVSTALLNLIKRQSRTCYGDFPQHLSHEIPHFYKNTVEVDEILPPEEFTPFIYDEKSDSESLIKRYRYTSTGFSIHQDFAGYYPMLMINMGVFYDGNGKDVYEEVYNLRIGIKKSLKDLKFMSREWIETNITQEGYKLILNSASGVLDGSHDTNLRANNKAMAMRIVGQLMTYIIAAALAIEGATIPSSNTDGIYVFNIDVDKNVEIVDRELQELYVEIDPEPVYLVSKDTNNRMELEERSDGTYKVVSARGGTLTSWDGAKVDKRLTHPALVDRVLTIYLQNDDVVNKPVDKELVRKALMEYRDQASMRDFVLMSSWVMRSTSGSIFVDSDNNIHPGTIRGWLSNDGVKLRKLTVAKKPIGKTLDAYAEDLWDDNLLGEPALVREIEDLGITNFFANALNKSEYLKVRNSDDAPSSVHAASEQKISNLSDTALIHIDNSSILNKSDAEIEEIFNNLNMDEYVDLIASFADVWHNELKPS